MAEPTVSMTAAVINVAVATIAVAAAWRLGNYAIDAGLLAGKKAIDFGSEALAAAPAAKKAP